MSLFNMVVGTDPLSAIVTQLLGFTKESFSKIPRFRDAYIDISVGDPKLVLLTRTGGNNRDDYVEENQQLREISGYIDDFDDDFDNTFSYWRYKVPEEHVDRVASLIKMGKEVGWKFPSPMDRFKNKIDQMRAQS